MSIDGYVKNNPALQVPMGKEGVDDVLERLFDYGTETVDEQELKQAKALYIRLKSLDRQAIEIVVR